MSAKTQTRLLSAYMRIWTFTNLFRIQIGFNAGTGLVGSTIDAGSMLNALFLPALISMAGLLPTRWAGAAPFIAMLARALTNLAKGSMMSNSQMWATQMDAAVMLAMGNCVWRRAAGARLAPLSGDEERDIVRSCARTIRWQLALFYFASGFWKINSSFLHPSYSCASLFMVQPLEYLPDALLFASDGVFATLIPLGAQLIATIGPVFTLALEAVVPALHALEPSVYPRCATVGVVLTLLFHVVIGLTPPPSNVSTYGVTTCTRLFFVLPEALAAAVEELGSATKRSALVGATMALAAGASLALVQPLHAVAPSKVQGDGIDWHLGYYMALCVLFGRAIMLELAPAVAAAVAPPPTEVKPLLEGPMYKKLYVLALVYAFGLPTLGLQEKAGCLMFSQLRCALLKGTYHVLSEPSLLGRGCMRPLDEMNTSRSRLFARSLHGGSNHYLLPTSLLQRALVDGEPSSAFAGGVVRVEATNLTWVGNTFAEHMGDRTIKLIRELAKVPSMYVWAAKATPGKRDMPPPRFVRHSLSALGLRRMLTTAVGQGDAFWLTYTKLDGVVGDEAWRTSSAGVEYTVRSRGGGAPLTCARRIASGAVCALGGCEAECDAREVALLQPPSGRLSALFAYFLIPQPNPIVPGLTDEMHCVTWG